MYEQVRTNPRRFIVRPGHEIPDVECVVIRANRYVIVEKDKPDAIRVAERTDPRA